MRLLGKRIIQLITSIWCSVQTFEDLPSEACPGFSMILDYPLALSMAPSKSWLRNRGSFSLVSSSPAIVSIPPVFWISGSLQFLPSGLSPRLDVPEAKAQKSRSLMLVMSQDAWFPNQDKTAVVLIFFFQCRSHQDRLLHTCLCTPLPLSFVQGRSAGRKSAVIVKCINTRRHTIEWNQSLPEPNCLNTSRCSFIRGIIKSEANAAEASSGRSNPSTLRRHITNICSCVLFLFRSRNSLANGVVKGLLFSW